MVTLIGKQSVCQKSLKNLGTNSQFCISFMFFHRKNISEISFLSFFRLWAQKGVYSEEAHFLRNSQYFWRERWMKIRSKQSKVKIKNLSGLVVALKMPPTKFAKMFLQRNCWEIKYFVLGVPPRHSGFVSTFHPTVRGSSPKHTI